MIPTHLNNLFNIKVGSVSRNGSMNMGNVLHKGHMANAYTTGGQNVVGDLSPSGLLEGNILSDPDLIDQPQTQV